MTPARWNLFAAFMLGMAFGTFGAGWGMHTFLTATDIKPRQDKIDELNRKNIELEGDRDKWRDRAVSR